MMNKTQIAVVSSLIAALILPTFTSYAQTHPLEIPPKAQNSAQNSLGHLGHDIAPSPSVVAPFRFKQPLTSLNKLMKANCLHCPALKKVTMHCVCIAKP